MWHITPGADFFYACCVNIIFNYLKIMECAHGFGPVFIMYGLADTGL